VPPPSESYFLKVWREHVPWLKCRAYNTFLLCDDCVSLNDRLRLAKTLEEKNKIWEEKRTHLYMVREERCEYAQRIILSKRRPDLYLLMTIDGSDNSSYGFPYFAQRRTITLPKATRSDRNFTLQSCTGILEPSSLMLLIW
jgi:hypothetical protein